MGKIDSFRYISMHKYRKFKQRYYCPVHLYACICPKWPISLIWRHSLVLTSPIVSPALLPRILTPNST